MSEEAKRKSPDDFEKAYRLQLGCGNVGLPGYVNVDVMQTLGVDVVDDIRFLKHSRAILPARSMTAMSWSISVMRKSCRSCSAGTMSWCREGKFGFRCRISTVSSISYSDNPQHFQTPGRSSWIGLIYGGSRRLTITTRLATISASCGT